MVTLCTMLVSSLRTGKHLYGFAHPAGRSMAALLMQQPVCAGHVPSRYVAAAEAFNVSGKFMRECKMFRHIQATCALLGFDPL